MSRSSPVFETHLNWSGALAKLCDAGFLFYTFRMLSFKMKVKIGGKTVKLKDNSSVFDALIAAKINPETVLVRRKNRLIPNDEPLKDNDALDIISVISGG